MRNLTLFPILVAKAGLVTVVLTSVLTGCGGGGGGSASTAGFQIPFTCTNVASSIAGCWASELCATNSGVPGARLVEVFEQTGSTPTLSGEFNSYLVQYDNAQCTGTPNGAIHINEVGAVGGFEATYEEQGFSICSDFSTSNAVSCVNLDITLDVNNGGVVTTGFTAYSITDVDNRLCLGTDGFVDDYNFDNNGDGGIGVPNATDINDRPIDILHAPNQCLTRINF